MACPVCAVFLYISSSPPDYASRPSTSKNIVPLSQLTLTCFCFMGSLDAHVAELSVPSLRDVNIRVVDAIQPPLVHLPRFIDEISVHLHPRTWRESYFLCSRDQISRVPRNLCKNSNRKHLYFAGHAEVSQAPILALCVLKFNSSRNF